MRKRSVTLLAGALVALCLAALAPSAPAAAVKGGGVISLHCRPGHQNNDDPIVFPGQPGAAHLHQFFGSKTTNALSTLEEMQASATTCPLAHDTAGYWVPVLLDPDGVAAPVSVMNAYYRSPPHKAVAPWPAGFQQVAGGDTQNTLGGTQNQVSYSCKDSGPFFANPPNCGSRLVIAHIQFPTTPGQPKLSIHVRYNIRDGRGYSLSSDFQKGFTDGRSLHADFWNTWDQDALAFLVETCLNQGRDCKGMDDAFYARLGGPA